MRFCSLITTHNKRAEFLDGFIYHYKRCGINIPLFVFTNDNTRVNCDLITYVFDDIEINGAFVSNDSGWGNRLKKAIKFLKDLDMEYIIFHPDDGWILDDEINLNTFNDIIVNMKKNNIDNYRLSQKIYDINNKLIDDNIEIINKVYLPHYLTHQTSIWLLKSLDTITYYNDTSGNHEYNGSNRCLQEQFNMAQPSKEPILDSIGINHCTVGYDLDKLNKSIKLGFDPTNYNK